MLARKILEVEHKNLDALKGLGLVKLKQHLYDDAINLFKEAFELNPKDKEIKIKLICALELQAKKTAFTSQLPKSIELIRYALKIEPSSSALLCRMSLLLSVSKNFIEALKFHSPGLAAVKDESGSYHIDVYGKELYKERYTRTFGYYCNRASVLENENSFHLNLLNFF